MTKDFNLDVFINFLKIKVIIKLNTFDNPNIIRFLIDEFVYENWLKDILYMFLDKQLTSIFFEEEFSDQNIKSTLKNELLNFCQSKQNQEPYLGFSDLVIEKYCSTTNSSEFFKIAKSFFINYNYWDEVKMRKYMSQLKNSCSDKNELSNLLSELNYSCKELSNCVSSLKNKFETMDDESFIKKLKIYTIEYEFENTKNSKIALNEESALQIFDFIKDCFDLDLLTLKYEYIKMKYVCESEFSTPFTYYELQSKIFQLENAYFLIYIKYFFTNTDNQGKIIDANPEYYIKKNTEFIKTIEKQEYEDIVNIRNTRIPLEKIKTWWKYKDKDEKRQLCIECKIKPNIFGKYNPNNNELYAIYQQSNRKIAKDKNEKYEEIKTIRNEFYLKNKSIEPKLFEKGYKLSICPFKDMVLIKGGTCIIGSNIYEQKRNNDEFLHKVKINDFYIGKYQVSQQLWNAVMSFKYKVRFEHQTNPMESISWYDTIIFCNEYSKLCGYLPFYNIDKKNKDKNNTNPKDVFKWNATINPEADGFRLPTEAEWEFACRCHTTTPFNTGENIRTHEANFNGRKPYSEYHKEECLDRTVWVNSYDTVGFGLHNIHGNVYEWCWDWYGEYNSDENMVKDNPLGAVSGNSRVLRGGSYCCDATDCRSANRFSSSPYHSSPSYGLRLARSIV